MTRGLHGDSPALALDAQAEATRWRRTASYRRPRNLGAQAGTDVSEMKTFLPPRPRGGKTSSQTRTVRSGIARAFNGGQNRADPLVFTQVPLQVSPRQLKTKLQGTRTLSLIQRPERGKESFMAQVWGCT